MTGLFTRLATPLFVKLAGVGLAAVAAIAALLWLMLSAERGRSDTLQRQLNAETAAHEVTVTRYRVAADEAQRMADTRAAMIETAIRTEQEKARATLANTRSDYDRRIARFVRSQADNGRSRASDIALPGTATLPSGPVPPPGTAIVSVADLERSAAAFAQLNALIDYVESLPGVMASASPE